jgi:hypothetical protein
VYRASKNNVPGQELVLYEEESVTPVSFGDITWALVGGSYYGYFVANYGAVSKIKRVPLTGGAAVEMATSPAMIGERQTLENDGSYLYWADTIGVRKMPIAGGAVTTLINSGANSLGLDNGFVYYAVGTQIFRIPKVGGGASLVATSFNPYHAINAIFVKPGSPTEVFWGQNDRTVVRKPVGGQTSLLTPPNEIYRTTAVWFDGTATLWMECTYVNGVCTLRRKVGSAKDTGVSAGIGSRFVVGDGGLTFFGNLSALHRVVN